MENGYLILGIIALLFLSMYGYAYFSVLKEKLQARKEKQLELEKEAERLRLRAERQREIDERVEKFNKRKEEIQREKLLLEKMKAKHKAG